MPTNLQEGVRPWERTAVIKAYAASETNAGCPVTALAPLLKLVSMNNRGSSMVDIIPAVLRGGSNPYATCCEMEAFIEVWPPFTTLAWMHTCNPSNNLATLSPTTATTTRRPIRISAVARCAAAAAAASPPAPICRQTAFKDDPFNCRKVINEIAKIKPAAPVVGVVIAPTTETVGSGPVEGTIVGQSAYACADVVVVGLGGAEGACWGRVG